jgi:hypothetical protein
LIATLKKSIIKKDDVQSEANKKKEVVCSAIKLVLALKDHDVSGKHKKLEELLSGIRQSVHFKKILEALRHEDTRALQYSQ